jgi:hypothetical protein
MEIHIINILETLVQIAYWQICWDILFILIIGFILYKIRNII